MEEVVDVFLTWVDGSDTDWQRRRNEYEDFHSNVQRVSNGTERYRNWENLKYVFRGIEKYLPWVRRVYFVTCGQIPDFLDTTNKKLVLINHTDYIPEEFLPTFNSNTIEMNLFRIKDLAENVLLFNDDTFIIDKIEKSYFIKDNVPGDEAIERIIGNIGLNHAHCMLNNAWIINKYKNKKESKKKNWRKWYTPKYGTDVVRNIIMSYFNDFEGLRNPHEPFLLKKHVFEKLWELEPEMLTRASKNRFRDLTDVTQYVVRYWTIFEGDFNPRKHRGKAWTVNDQNYTSIADAIRTKKYPLISIDEKIGEKLVRFEDAKREINSAFEEILPDKSSFEK